jgi:hypothetical protein
MVERRRLRVAEDPPEDADGLLHLGHGANGDAGVRLLVRREIAPDQHAGRTAGVTEPGRGPLDVHEDEVRLRVGAGNPHVGERLDGERLHLGVALPLLLDVRGVAQADDGAAERQRAEAVWHLVRLDRLDRRGVADRVAGAEACHAVGLRERARHVDVRRGQRDVDGRLIRRVGDVVVIRLVDEDRRVG